nr:MAG TPA: hypothetical protein [Caudoviricetes sp.]
MFSSFKLIEYINRFIYAYYIIYPLFLINIKSG